jgi:hypothetical protein
MRIVIAHSLTHDDMPTNSCFFCGYPIIERGITCIDDTAHDKVLGMVCTTCVQRKPVQLQATLGEKAHWRRHQAALLEQRAARLVAQAGWLERLARQPLTLPSVPLLEDVLYEKEISL